MALAAEFLALMPMRITVEPYSAMSTDGFGGRAYGTALTFAARLEQDFGLVKDSQQRNVTGLSGSKIIMDVDATDGTRHICSASDRITLPSELLSQGVHPNPPIQNVQPVYDETGLHHQVVTI